MAQPLFDQIVRHSRLSEYRKTKAAKGVKSATLPSSVQHI
jgi:hypothetical protein